MRVSSSASIQTRRLGKTACLPISPMRPSRSSTWTALGASWRPAPISPNSGALSTTWRMGAISAALERRHHRLGHPLELLQHDLLRRAHAGAEVDVLETGIALLELLQMLDQSIGRAGEPGTGLHEVLHGRHAGIGPAAAARRRRDLR